MTILFQDRNEAGIQLSTRIINYLTKELPGVAIKSMKDQVVVLCIPRGGVIMGDVVASSLGCSLDVVISRKIRAEFNEEFAVGAVMPDGSYFINEYAFNMFKFSHESLEKEIDYQKKEIQRRLNEFRGTSFYGNKFSEKIVILVDDGIATGATILASAQWLKKNYTYRHFIVAVPVAPARDETIIKLSQYADKVIVLHSLEDFQAVGQFYKYFEQVTDDEVKIIMRKYGYNV